MKFVVGILLLMVPALASAQGQGGISEADMQKMMQKAQAMQKCMDKVDQSALEAFGKRAEALDAELQKLCSQGQRDKAQQKAMAFGREMEKDANLTQMKKCSKIMEGMVPQPQTILEKDYRNGHVCDK